MTAEPAEATSQPRPLAPAVVIQVAWGSREPVLRRHPQTRHPGHAQTQPCAHTEALFGGIGVDGGCNRAELARRQVGDARRG
jgi:hypothetical protein